MTLIAECHCIIVLSSALLVLAISVLYIRLCLKSEIHCISLMCNSIISIQLLHVPACRLDMGDTTAYDENRTGLDNTFWSSFLNISSENHRKGKSLLRGRVPSYPSWLRASMLHRIWIKPQHAFITIFFSIWYFAIESGIANQSNDIFFYSLYWGSVKARLRDIIKSRYTAMFRTWQISAVYWGWR